jgi:hypothetical protein
MLDDLKATSHADVFDPPAASSTRFSTPKLVDNAKPGNDVTWDIFQQPARPIFDSVVY